MFVLVEGRAILTGPRAERALYVLLLCIQLDRLIGAFFIGDSPYRRKALENTEKNKFFIGETNSK